MTYVAQVPKLKEITECELSNYIYYECGEQQAIMRVDTLKRGVTFYERQAGVAIDKLPVLQNEMLNVDYQELLDSIPEGVYVFDVVIYNSYQYVIVDLLADTGEDLNEMIYTDRLKRCASLFEYGTPQNFYVKHPTIYDVKTYKGSECLIVKESVSTLRYNMDYKYLLPAKVYKIVGYADVVHYNLSNDVAVWRHVAHQLNINAGKDSKIIPSSARTEVLKLIKKKINEPVRNDLFIKTLKRVYLVADNKNLIFGTCTGEDSVFDGKESSKTTSKVYRWLMSNPKQRFLNVRFFKTPSVASFTHKFTGKADLYKMNLKRLICDEGDRNDTTCNIERAHMVETLPAKMRAISMRFSKNSLSNLVVMLLEKLNLAHFSDNMEDFNEHHRLLEHLLEMLDAHGGGGAIQNKSPIKRKLSGSADGKGKKQKRSVDDDEEADEDAEEMVVG